MGITGGWQRSGYRYDARLVEVHLKLIVSLSSQRSHILTQASRNTPLFFGAGKCVVEEGLLPASQSTTAAPNQRRRARSRSSLALTSRNIAAWSRMEWRRRRAVRICYRCIYIRPNTDEWTLNLTVHARPRPICPIQQHYLVGWWRRRWSRWSQSNMSPSMGAAL